MVLAFEHIAVLLQLGAQFGVIFDNAVVYQGNAGLAIALPGKMRVSVVGGRRAMRGPACMRDAGEPLHMILVDLRVQFGYALRAPGSPQYAIGMHGHAAGIIPSRSEEHTSELQSLMRISYSVFCL